MDYNTFLTNLIENLIASVPQLVAVISMVMYSLNNLKKQTAEFPNQLSVVKENLITDFKETKLMVQDMLAESRKTMNGLVEEATTQLREEVTDVMGSMQEELKYYRETLQSVKAQANLLVKENRAMFDLVIQLVAKNPELVKKGLASTITNSLTLTQEELKNYSVQMIDSLPLLETVLKEALVNYTQEEIDGVMESIGYEKRT
jgi:predicted Zn-dependent protease with MMP-like domain